MLSEIESFLSDSQKKKMTLHESERGVLKMGSVRLGVTFSQTDEFYSFCDASKSESYWGKNEHHNPAPLNFSGAHNIKIY